MKRPKTREPKRSKSAATKITCRRCKIEMNHHADKLVQPVDSDEASRADPELGGIVQEHYVCPSCGRSDVREATT
jgi:hypothetical protein